MDEFDSDRESSDDCTDLFRRDSDNDEFETDDFDPPVNNERGLGAVAPKPKAKGKRRPGRPKKAPQATVVGGSNQEILAAKKKPKTPKPPKAPKSPVRSTPTFDPVPEPQVLARSLGTNELLDKLGYRDQLNDEDEEVAGGDRASSKGPEHENEEEREALIDAIKYYEKLWEKYPHLTLVPGLKRKDFTLNNATIEDVELEIEKVEEIGEKPFKDKMYTQIWFMIALFIGKTVSITPLGNVLEPDPSPLNPRPATLSNELMQDSVVKEARPVVEELFDMFPMLEYLGNLGDPRVKLAYTVSAAAYTVYKKNAPFQTT